MVSHDKQETVSHDRQETSAERLDREVEELFHELRSIIPGAEVLFAFLLTVAFTAKFAELTTTQRWTYFGTFLCSGLALVLLLAPSAFHRMRFRQGDKEVMMRAANREALTALVLISFAIAGTIYLITDVMFDTAAAVVASGSVWLVAAVLWWGYPLTRGDAGHDSG
jgi:cation transport ATPase